jgi:DNA-binding LytR/AlgR family response regulator
MKIQPSTNILVVEDHQGFLTLLIMLLEDLGIKHIQSALNYESGWDTFQKKTPDICIVDIDLGKNQKNGIELAERIREKDPFIPIIFLTANYTEKYYELSKHIRPSCFMNKELSLLKLYQAIDLALLSRSINPSTEKMGSITPPHEIPFLNQSCIFFKVGDFYKNIPIDEIAFFYAQGKMTYAKVEKRNLPTNVQLKILEKELHPKFIRIHKTYLVNIKYIDTIHLKEDKVEIIGEQLPIGLSYRKDFLDQLKLLK